MLIFSHKITLAVIIFCYSNTSYGADLILFGKNCLAKEMNLNKAKARLEQSEKIDTSLKALSGRATEVAQRYQKELTQLEARKEECASANSNAKNHPNSPFCHETRQRYYEVTRFLQEQKEEVAILYDSANDTAKFINRVSFEKQQKRFFAQCRNSDTHYHMINSPTAYSEVCLKGNNKETITCSFF